MRRLRRSSGGRDHSAHEGALYRDGEARTRNGIDYLAQHAPSVVGAFADAIEGAVKDVTEFPFLAQETETKGVRRKYVRRFHYCIFYTIEDSEVVVLHIRHAAQQLPWEKNNAGKPD